MRRIVNWPQANVVAGVLPFLSLLAMAVFMNAAFTGNLGPYFFRDLDRDAV